MDTGREFSPETLKLMYRFRKSIAAGTKGNFTPRNEASGIPMDTAVVKGAAGLSPTNVFSITT